MPRRNKPTKGRTPQHGKKKKRQRSWHRNQDSPGMRQAQQWLREAA
jgi:hypothetical protein